MIWGWRRNRRDEEADPLTELEGVLGYTFRSRQWLEMALIHPSHRFEGEAPGPADNQRLEFIGDAALGLTVAEELFRRYPEWDEGRLTQERSRLTKGTMLVEVARRHDLGRWLKLGRGEERTGGRNRESNLEDLVEAILGAAYLDGGMPAVSTIVRTLWTQVPSGGVVKEWDNPKGGLQEIAQKRWHQQPVYEIIGMEGPPHERDFVVRVSVQSHLLGEGRGRSRRAAEQEAARNALQNLLAGGRPGES